MKSVQAVYGIVNSGEGADGVAVDSERVGSEPVGKEEGGGCESVLVWSGGLSEVFSSKPLDLSWQKITAQCST